ncbi:hypothetical protein [Porphyrobacter sp. GA68]|uniref:hypothetical protein n=1 Tax=Porphyrobacter sp. GA68 TaxID=2883480 RepID=UPI001D17DBF8|nr:hypothetical protein [Porphyrobacter sp. GA68]
MTEHITDFGHGFHHIRGQHRIGGLVDVGTHCSLVRLADGGAVFLDSYTLPGDILAQVRRMTANGADVRAILNLHPFHTVHCEWMHRTFPDARLYGTRRHRDRLPHLPWDDVLCEEDGLAERFGADLNFSVPGGVDLVCEKENVHFASVLAFHPGSGTIHVDDTLSCVQLPGPLRGLPLPMTGSLRFHPTLASALKPEPGAADAFTAWAYDLGADWHDARRVATAHNSVVELHGDFPERIGEALGQVQPVLARHRRRHG